jgi:diguanylate cyclase (GGDEF)-like protein
MSVSSLLMRFANLIKQFLQPEANEPVGCESETVSLFQSKQIDSLCENTSTDSFEQWVLHCHRSVSADLPVQLFTSLSQWLDDVPEAVALYVHCSSTDLWHCLGRKGNFKQLSVPCTFNSLFCIEQWLIEGGEFRLDTCSQKRVAWVSSDRQRTVLRWEKWCFATSSLLTLWMDRSHQKMVAYEGSALLEISRMLLTYGLGRKALTSLMLQWFGVIFNANEVELWFRPTLASTHYEKESTYWLQGFGLVSSLFPSTNPPDVAPMMIRKQGWQWHNGQRVWLQPIHFSGSDSDDTIMGYFIIKVSTGSSDLSDYHRSLLTKTIPLLNAAYAAAWQYDQAVLLANLDELTGLVNRRGFYQRFELELARLVRHGKSLGIALIDVDNFKGLNDTYGHLVGDKVLKQLSQLISAKIRKTDLVARFGGEEFALILPEISERSAFELLERLRVTIGNETFHIEDANQSLSLNMTISAGLTLASIEQNDVNQPNDLVISQLLGQADASLYQAKYSGRNQVKLYGDTPVTC